MITRCIQMYLYYLIVLLVVFIADIESVPKIMYAINCGGDDHVDYNGIPFKKDPLEGKIGTASDFGRRFIIGRVPPEDQILYQTERYHDSNFGYHIPIRENGNYVLVLKFSEVYFNEINEKVFDIKLNSHHTIVSDLDIFAKVKKGVAHDEYIPFIVSNSRLYVNSGQDSDIKDDMVFLEFVKRPYKDNPKINAFYLLKGTLEDVPLLPPIEVEIPEEDFKEEVEDESKRNRRPSGPALPDPYSIEDTSMMLPVFIAIGAFIPILFCLCKL